MTNKHASSFLRIFGRGRAQEPQIQKIRQVRTFSSYSLPHNKATMRPPRGGVVVVPISRVDLRLYWQTLMTRSQCAYARQQI